MPIPEVRKFKVLSREDIADGILGLALAPADDQALFSFFPGQWVMLHAYNSAGELDGKAAYSIASAPEESKDRILLAIRLRNGFTRRVKELKLNEIVGVQGPFGAFTPREESVPLVMLAGGIGVAPFRSIVRALASKARPMTLIYSNRTLESMAFEQELRSLSEQYPNFHPVFVLTGEAPKGWVGEIGRVGDELLVKNMAPNAEYLACGPVEFVRDMKKILATRGVDITTKFRQEIF